MMTRSVRMLAFVFLVTSLAACSGRGARPGINEDAMLTVDNESLDDLTMYLVTDAGTRNRLGDALSLRKTSLRIYGPWLLGTGEVQFVGVPKTPGRPVTRSETMHMEPGDSVSIIITP